jgi:hypothetical protein
VARRAHRCGCCCGGAASRSGGRSPVVPRSSFAAAAVGHAHRAAAAADVAAEQRAHTRQGSGSHGGATRQRAWRAADAWRQRRRRAARQHAARASGAERGTRTGGRRLHRRGQLNGRSVVDAAAVWRGACACATSAAAPREADTTAPEARGGRRLVQTWQLLHSRQGRATERSGAPRARAARHALAPGSEAAAVLEVAAHRLARLQAAAEAARQRGQRDMGTPRKVRAAGPAAAPRAL